MRGRRTLRATWTSTGWQYLSRNSDTDPSKVSVRKPLVYFGSFQDLLGRDAAGNIKAKNEWLHKLKWDLVVFDEYHFGAWARHSQGAVRGRGGCSRQEGN